MIKKILHRIIFGTLCFGFCLACTSCSQESITPPVSAIGNGQVKILYQIEGASLSRDTEDGWNVGWNENEIDRIDLLVFDAGGTCVHHIVETGIGVTDAQQENSYTNFKKNSELNELTYAEVAENKDNYTYYMIANCDLDDITEGKSTLENLKAKPTLGLTFNKQQEHFAMDGKLETTDVVIDETTKTATLRFDLARAAVKIRVSVYDEEGKNIGGQCTFRLHNYVLDGTSVLAEEEENWYGEGIGQTRTPESPELGWNDVLNKDNKAVFYSYPNDWFDESLLKDDGTFSEDDIYAKDDLIDEAEQTYILLTATIDGVTNEYKVPVNQQIDKDNDKVSFTADEIKDLQNKYYRILRNHIYDITVRLNGPQEVEIMVNVWDEKENMDVIFGGN